MGRILDFLRGKAIQNGIWMYLLQFFNTIVPLMTLPYVTRILGTDRYGVFTVALNLVMYLQVVVEYGFNLSATRKVALNGRDGLDETFSAVLCSRVILLGLCAAFCGFYALLHPDNPDVSACLLVLLVVPLGSCFQVNWIFQGMQEMRFISLVNIGGRLLSLVCIFLFVRTPGDLLRYCLFYSVSPFFSGLAGMELARRRYLLRFARPTFSRVLAELRDGFYIFTTELSAKVFGAIGVTFMGFLADWSMLDYGQIGIFGATQKIANLMLLLWVPIAQVLYPVSGNHMREGFAQGRRFVLRMRRMILPFFVAAALVIGIFSHFIVGLLFGAEYAVRSYWVIPLLVWMILAVNNNFLGVQILLASGHDKEYSKCFQIGVACTVLSNLVLIFLFKGDGAAIAPALSESVLGMLLLLQIRKLLAAAPPAGER